MQWNITVTLLHICRQLMRCVVDGPKLLYIPVDLSAWRRRCSRSQDEGLGSFGACVFFSQNNRFSFFKSCGLRLKIVVAAAFPCLTLLPVALILQGSLRLIPVVDVLGRSEAHVEFPQHLDTPFDLIRKQACLFLAVSCFSVLIRSVSEV